QLAKFLLVFLALQFFGSIGLGIWLFVHRCAGENGRHFHLARCKTITTESKCIRLHLGVTEMLQFGASFACGRTTTTFRGQSTTARCEAEFTRGPAIRECRCSKLIRPRIESRCATLRSSQK